MPIISVIVPTHRRNHLLPRALQSLYAQTFGDFEIILVDDNPPESRVRSDSSLKPYLAEARLRIVEHDQPRNAASARNVGLRHAKGTWIAYLDDDDAYAPTKLQKQLERAKETRLPLGLCGLGINLPRRRRLQQVQTNSFRGADLLLRAISGTVVIFHRNTNGAVLFDERLKAGEDTYFFHSLIRFFEIAEVFNVPEPLVEVFPQPGARVNTSSQGSREAMTAIWRDFGSLYGGEASNIYRARADFQLSKFQDATFFNMLTLAVSLLRVGGATEWRVIVNGLLYKVPATRRFVVS